MGISDNLKEKLIIIAGSDVELVIEIRTFLKKKGFNNINVANNGKKIYEILRPLYNDPEQVGLIIVSDNLPQCKFMEMCLTLSGGKGGATVPFIVIKTNEGQCDLLAIENQNHFSKHFIECVTLPINFSEFLIIVQFQLRIKQERILRYKHEEHLINELAERRVVDAKLKYLVVHDELTGLLNRQNFERRLRLILNGINRLHQNAALLFIDVDMFSLINELEGFEFGDSVLIQLVSIIRKRVSKNDLFARIGSDEFCLFLDNRSEKEVLRFAEKIRKDVYDARFFIGDACYSSSISIGVSSLNTSKAVYHPGEMISRASQACLLAKENGRNMIWEYNKKDNRIKQRDKDVYWVPLIRQALVERKFFLVYQPIVDLQTGVVSHHEALIRMRGINNEVIQPEEFIPVAERIGLIHRIDLWVIEQAIDFLASLSATLENTSLAINLSSVAFQDESLLPTIKEKLEITWVDPKRVIFEITETVAVNTVDQTQDLIAKIRALGCKFALDDFGAGFCSYNYLKSFSVEYIKIDGQFIRNLIDNEMDQVLVKSMVDVANKLGKKTIAEFVDKPETVKKLIELGVDLGQGYYFGKPLKKLLPEKYISFDKLEEAHLGFQEKQLELGIIKTASK